MGTVENTNTMNTNVAKPRKVAIIGASGTYGKGILTLTALWFFIGTMLIIFFALLIGYPIAK